MAEVRVVAPALLHSLRSIAVVPSRAYACSRQCPFPVRGRVQTWDGLKREARALEVALEQRVQAFGRIDALGGRSAGDEGARVRPGMRGRVRRRAARGGW